MSKKYKCTICSYKCKTNTLLNRHGLIHSNIKEFKCEICSKSFIRKFQLYQHLPIHFKNYGLSKSDIKSMPLNVLCQQYKPIVKSDYLKCSICSKVCNSRPHMRSHMVKHSSLYKYCCGICTKSWKRLDELRQHFFKVHKEHYNDYKDYSFEDDLNFAPDGFNLGKKFECDICHKRFTTKENIRVHMMIHMNLKPLLARFAQEDLEFDVDYSNISEHIHWLELDMKKTRS